MMPIEDFSSLSSLNVFFHLLLICQVKDNAELLAKSIKKREKQKQQSKKKWDERVEAQEKQKEDRQKKRKVKLKIIVFSIINRIIIEYIFFLLILC